MWKIQVSAHCVSVQFLLKMSSLYQAKLFLPKSDLWVFCYQKQPLRSLCCCCLVIKSRPTFCDPMDCSPPDSSVHEISQARILEWVAISSSRGSSCPRAWTWNSCIGKQILYHWATWEAPGPPIPDTKLSKHGGCDVPYNLWIEKN